MYSEDWDDTEQITLNEDIALQVMTTRTAFNEPDMVEYINFAVSSLCDMGLIIE